jgi:hypothetical protein
VRAIALVIAAAAGCGRIGFDAELGLAPAVARINTGSTLAFTASGGAPPYAFATDLGSIDAGGALHASSTAGTATVTVTDAAGDTATAVIDIGGDFIFRAAGNDSGVLHDEVYRTADGIEWTLVGRLPAPRTYGSLVTFDDQLYYMGGWIDMTDGMPADDVWRSPDGVTWTAIGKLPQLAAAQGVTVWNGRMWLGDGRVDADSYTPTLWSSSDGVEWRVEPPLPVAGHNIMLVPVRDELWTVAGHHELAQSAEVHASTDAATWRTVGAVPAAGEYIGTCVYADRLWVAGGLGLSTRIVSTTDGATWTDATPFALDRQYVTALSFRGELWMVGGIPADTLHSPDGVEWTVLPPFPLLVQGANAVQFTPP